MIKGEKAAPTDVVSGTADTGGTGGEAGPETVAAASGDADPETDARARFRQALERKNASPGAHPGSQASEGNRLHASNGKRQRQFRRKSG